MSIQIQVDSRLRFLRSAIPDAVYEQLVQLFTYPNPAWAKMERMAQRDKRLRYALKNIPLTLTSYRVIGEGLQSVVTLPRGATNKLRELLRSAGLTWTTVDNRDKGQAIGKMTHRPDPKAADGGALRWYQEEAIEAAISKENCLLRAPTGSGKTSMAMGLIARLGLKTVVMVWSSGLMEQWIGRLQTELGMTEDEIGIIGGGSWQMKGVTVAMQQTLFAAFKRDVDGTQKRFAGVGLLVTDETQRFAASSFIDVIDNIPARYRIGISADESRHDGKEPLIYDEFGAVAHEVFQDQLIEEGSVLDVECRLVQTNFEATWYNDQLSRGVPDFKRLIDEMVVDEDRNKIAVELAKQEAVAGEQVILLTQRVEHAQRLEAMISAYGIKTGLMLGGTEWSGRFAQAKSGLADGTLHAVAGTIQAVGTGLDMPSLSRGVLVTPVGSNRQLYGQIRGRLCRPGKGNAFLYMLWDRHIQGLSVLRRMLSWNRIVLVRDTDGSWVNGREYLKRETENGS